MRAAFAALGFLAPAAGDEQIDPALLIETATHLTEDGHSMDQRRADIVAAWLRVIAAHHAKRDA